MKLSIMAAMSHNRVIGKENRLPWPHIPADWANLHQVCYGKKMIMGRKSYDTPDRVWSEAGNIVITRQQDYEVEEGFTIAHSLEDALTMVKGENEVFIIGGEEIFRQSIHLIETIHLTIIHKELAGDAFFPEFEEKFTEVSRADFKADSENLYDYSFLVYERVPHATTSHKEIVAA